VKVSTCVAADETPDEERILDAFAEVDTKRTLALAAAYSVMLDARRNGNSNV
jgi:hypothetical protein